MIRKAGHTLGRLIQLWLGAFIIMSFAMLGWTFLWPAHDIEVIKTSDAIVCLGGGMSPDGILAPAVLTRIERCVQLHNAGVAPVVVFTGGTAHPNGPDAGSQMAKYAVTLGLPETAIIRETAAQSTLQNALFSIDLTPDLTEIVIVSEAFHLPRSWASFKWAAWERGRAITINIVMSEPVRRHSDGSINWRILGRESLAIWFNATRAGAFSIASAAGWAEERRMHWLH